MMKQVSDTSVSVFSSDVHQCVTCAVTSALVSCRYKIVVLAHVGQKLDQDVRIGSRCLWDDKRDTWASASYQNQFIYAVAEVYALNKE